MENINLRLCAALHPDGIHTKTRQKKKTMETHTFTGRGRRKKKGKGNKAMSIWRFGEFSERERDADKSSKENTKALNSMRFTVIQKKIQQKYFSVLPTKL